MIIRKPNAPKVESRVRPGMKELASSFNEWWTEGKGFAEKDFSLVTKAAWSFELAFIGIILIKDERELPAEERK
jgi:hypothetical protein